MAGVQRARRAGGHLRGASVGLVAEPAQVAQGALAEARLARGAHVAAVQDQPVVGVEQVVLGHAPQQRLLDLQHVLARREPGAVGQPEDVSVDRHRRLAEDGVEHHVGGLAADAGQGLERLALGRDLAAVAFEQQARQRERVLRLVAEQADGLDAVGNAFLAERDHGVGRGCEREQPARCEVDAAVGGLRRQHHRDQQLVGRGVLELGLRVRVGVVQAAEELADRLALHRSHAGRQLAAAGSAESCSGSAVFVGAGGGRRRARAARRTLMALNAAISTPSAKKAPGGRMAIRKPG